MSVNGSPTQRKESIMPKTHAATPKVPGKCAALRAMWNEAGQGEPLPGQFAIAMGVAEGYNPSTCRTQAQAWLRTFQQQDEMAALVAETAH